MKSLNVLKLGLPIVIVGLTTAEAYSNACYNNPSVATCDGQDPVATGCINSGYTVNRAYGSLTCCCSPYQPQQCGPGQANCAVKTYNFVVQLWWSPHCKTNWGRTWIYNGYAHATECNVKTNDNRPELPFHYLPGNACYGDMRYSPTVGAKAVGGLWPTGDDSECFARIETPGWV